MEQQQKLNMLGVGPRIAIWTIPTLVITITLACVLPDLFIIRILPAGLHTWIGWIMLAGGILFYGLTIKTLVAGIKGNKLITSGTFRYSQNPLYASLILFIIPAVSFLLGSWLIILSSITGYLAFKKYIRGEYDILAQLFGEEYKQYKNKTSEFIPWPW